LFSGIAGLVIALLAVIWITDARNDARTELDTAPVPHFQTATERQIAFTDAAQVSRGQDPMLVQLDSGTIPADVTRLTVLTDEDCAPDQDGVSHCLNRVRFETAQGPGEAAIRHHHRMSEESCLAPGEVVVIAA
jgi:hypothetical protein